MRFCGVLKPKNTQILQTLGEGLALPITGLMPLEGPSHSHLTDTKVWGRCMLEALESHMGGVGRRFLLKKDLGIVSGYTGCILGGKDCGSFLAKGNSNNTKRLKRS